MPELPEVETVRRLLEASIVDQTIDRVDLLQPAVLAHPDPERLSERLKGRRIIAVLRRGKFLQIALNNGSRLIVHLRMTGCLLPAEAGTLMARHTHLIVHFVSGLQLRFVDPRRFGRIWLLEEGEEDKLTGLAKLGLEPDDPALDGRYLQEKLGRRRTPVKTCLLDQSVAAGIGNIYSDEILFDAKIPPQKAACTLSLEQWSRLAETIARLLDWFTEKNAIELEDYVASRGKEYRNTPWLQVYGQAGKPCPRCGHPLVRQVISQRSSVFCPCCQQDENENPAKEKMEEGR